MHLGCRIHAKPCSIEPRTRSPHQDRGVDHNQPEAHRSTTLERDRAWAQERSRRLEIRREGERKRREKEEAETEARRREAEERSRLKVRGRVARTNGACHNSLTTRAAQPRVAGAAEQVVGIPSAFYRNFSEQLDPRGSREPHALNRSTPFADAFSRRAFRHGLCPVNVSRLCRSWVRNR